MEEFLKNLRRLFGWGGTTEDNERQVVGEPVEEAPSDRRVDSTTPFRSRFQDAMPITFNVVQDPKIADAARRTDLYAYPTNGTLDQTIAMNADDLKGLLQNYYNANDWNAREQAASAIRSRVNQIDPEGRSQALNKWIDYFNGGHHNISTGQGVVDLNYFMEELGRVLDDSKSLFIRRV